MISKRIQLVDATMVQSGLTDISKEVVDRLITGMIDVIESQLAKREMVQISGLGTFAVINREERNGHNPRTGKSVVLPAKEVVQFRLSARLKAAPGKVIESEVATVKREKKKAVKAPTKAVKAPKVVEKVPVKPARPVRVAKAPKPVKLKPVRQVAVAAPKPRKAKAGAAVKAVKKLVRSVVVKKAPAKKKRKVVPQKSLGSTVLRDIDKRLRVA